MNINPCPNPECRKTCRVGHLDNQWHVWCGCGYDGVWKNSSAEAIRLHNLISPQPSAPVQPNPIGANMLPHGSPFAVPVQPVAWMVPACGPSLPEYPLTHASVRSAPGGIERAIKEGYTPLYASPSAQPQPEEAAREDGVLIDGPHGGLSSHEYAFQIYKNGCVGNPYWMIERGSPAQWWVGNNRAKEEWTTDSFWAMRIVSKEMATLEMEKLLKYCDVKGPLRVTDHLDVTSSAAPEPSVAAETCCDLCGCYIRDNSCINIKCEKHVWRAPGIVPGWVNTPDAQGLWWYWSGYEDDTPYAYTILWSGTANKYFVCIRDIGNAPFCDTLPGKWLRIPQAAAPKGQP